jgi:heptosyltransferase-3
MRILFIKLRHIGDSLLLTPTIVATKQKFPHAEIWVLVRESCDGILVGCPEIDRILTTANPDAAKRRTGGFLSDLKLAALLRRTRFDHVFELTDNDRARFLALAARTPNRCTNKHRTLRWFWRPFFDRVCQTPRYRNHQVWRDYICPMETLDLAPDPGPLRFAESRTIPWRACDYESGEPFAVLHLHTRWERKSWPIDRWEALIPKLLNLVPRLLISCGPDTDEVDSARSLCEKFGPAVQTTSGTATWSQLAWLLKRAKFFVGVDTAAMHLAAACQCPTVALFGPSPVFEYHPWMVRHWMVRPENPSSADASTRGAMHKIGLDAVFRACTEANVLPKTDSISTAPRHRSAQRTLFFLANLDPLDGSAHALYCLRNVISLANNCPPGWKVEFLHASRSKRKEILDLHEASDCPELELTGLPHLRRGKGSPFHFNAVFHHAVLWHLRKRARAGDILCTASFPEMFRLITGKLADSRIQTVYEVHQLEILSRDEGHRKCSREHEALARANRFITTCLPLVRILEKRYPEIPCHHLGLAASYSSVRIRSAVEPPFKIGYFGSLSIEQGVPWLAKEWKNIRLALGRDVELHIFGRSRKNEAPLEAPSASGIHIHDPVPSNAVPAASENLNGLIIPALDLAHRASIAFTKAYDYAGLGLPILCSDLPTIREVLDAERHALYFPPGDAQALAHCLSRLLANPGLADSMASNLRQRASELSWDSRARRWWEAVLQ